MINRIKKSFTAVPASIAEAVKFLLSIAEKQKEINRIKRDAAEKVKSINTEAKMKITPLERDRDIFFTALYSFAVGKRGELTAKSRSVDTSAGRFGWRWTPPAVTLAEGTTEEEMIILLESAGYDKYVRVVKEIDREALLRDRPDIPGVEYVQREEFFAKPKMEKDAGRASELACATVAIDV